VLVGHADQFGIESGRHSGRDAAANHEPEAPSSFRLDGGFDAVQLDLGERRAGMVELHGEALAVVMVRLVRISLAMGTTSRGKPQPHMYF